jgi:hypothetical protein
VSAPGNGQVVEYACYTTNVVLVNDWQESLTFTGLNENTAYLILARTAENTNYLAGVTSASLQVTTDKLTSAETLPEAASLRAWLRNGMLHVTGLTVGKVCNVYSVSGALVYTSIAASGEMDIPLSVQGVYIVQNNDRTARVVIE